MGRSRRALLTVALLLALCTTLCAASAWTRRLAELRAAQGAAAVDECAVCRDAVSLVRYLLSLNFTLQEMEKPFVDLCTRLVFPSSEHPMCPGVIATYAPSIVEVISANVLSPDALCSFLRYCNTSSEAAEAIERGRARVAAAAREHFAADRRSARRRSRRADARQRPVAAPRAPLRVLQLTDFHFDSDYTAGAAADCGDIVCCRPNDVKGSRVAGRFGDYTCDLSPEAALSMLQFIAYELPAMDLILWTGDNPPHDMWEESRETQLTASTQVNDMLAMYFARSRGSLFPSLGNHEGYPANLYYQQYMQWLIDGMLDLWKYWLPGDVLAQAKEALFYTLEIRPKLRLVVVNSQFGYLYNWYNLMPNQTEAQRQYDWLESTLAAAEAAGEKVVLSMHHPAGASDMLDDWGFHTHAIVNKYAHVIALQVSGHVHTDQFQVFVASDGSGRDEPVNVMYIAPSATTFTNENPSFRVFELDPDTYETLNYYQYHLNITRANAEDKATWELFYDAKSAYGLPDLSPASWLQASQRMFDDSALAAKYRFNRHTGVYPENSCNFLCRREMACETQTIAFAEYSQCMSLPRNNSINSKA